MAERDHWECTDQMQQELIKLYSKNKKQWQKKICAMIREHPSKFSILTVGVTDDGDNLYTFEEFKDHFKGVLNDKLLKLMYDDMDHVDENNIKFVAIHRWMNEVKVAKKIEIRKDNKWLFEKLAPVQAADLDEDGGGTVDKKEFTDYMVDKIGIDKELALAIFNDIDANGDGDLSILEYARWKSKHSKASKLQKFFKNGTKSTASDSKKGTKPGMQKALSTTTPNKPKNDKDDEKCQQLMKELNKSKTEIQALNKKYHDLELEVKSINSKHANLLQVRRKMYRLQYRMLINQFGV